MTFETVQQGMRPVECQNATRPKCVNLGTKVAFMRWFLLYFSVFQLKVGYKRKHFEQLYSPREVAYNNIEHNKQKQDRTDRTEKKAEQRA